MMKVVVVVVKERLDKKTKKKKWDVDTLYKEERHQSELLSHFAIVTRV